MEAGKSPRWISSYVLIFSFAPAHGSPFLILSRASTRPTTAPEDLDPASVADRWCNPIAVPLPLLRK